MKPIWVYLAAPYTHPDPVENTHWVCKTATLLWKLGYIPIVPHLSLLWHIVDPHPIQTWYAYTMALLSRCDVLLRLDGHSVGADGEVTYAAEHEIPIVVSVEELKILCPVTPRGPVEPCGEDYGNLLG